MTTEDEKKDVTKVNYAICTELTIGGENFTAVLLSEESSGVKLKACWDNSSGGILSLQVLAEHIGISLPDFSSYNFTLTSVALEYSVKNGEITFDITFNKDKKITLRSFVLNNVRCYTMILESTGFISFSNIPILGGMLSYGDGIEVSKIEVKSQGDGGIIADITIVLKVGQTEKEIAFNISKSGDTNSVLAEPKWIDVNKSFKVVTLHRIGVLFEDGIITVFIDSSFSIAVLTLNFNELYISTAVPPDIDKFNFGLSGLMVSFNKPPLTLGGGLYKNQNTPDCPMLYDGEIKVGFSKFLLTALGSYGELESGEKSLFIYLMLSYPLGGPPFFFVTGLAAGFGVNRKFMLPELREVKSFPLVSAALKENTSVSEKTKPAEVLNLLSKHLVPSAGDYFVTVGVAFKSFNMFSSFALLTVAFGNNLNVSVLGISDVSLPPNLKSNENPVAYAQLVLKAVYDNNEGSFKVDAMLTEESYLLDRSCKLTGGFAFYVWGKGEHRGDFAVTLGSFAHPDFVKPEHYPVVDKLAINWKVNDKISVTGYAYFGLTPSCLMAGGGLKIQYESGKLTAWLTATIDMLIKWKPFYYDVRISISLGAAYRGILATYKLQASADLHVWGPDFSGTLHVEWFIISFTISFGSGAQKPSALKWNEFYDSFLPNEISNQTGTLPLTSNANDQKKKLLSVRVCGGIITELKEQNTLLVNAEELLLETRCEMPCKILSFNDKCVFESNVSLGVVPMGITDYKSEHGVTMTYHSKANREEVVSGSYIVEPVLENINSALWLNREPGINDKVIKDVPTGLSIKIKEADISSERLPKFGRYSLKVLESLQVVSKEFSWSKEKPLQNKLKSTDIYSEIKSSIISNEKKSGLLEEMASLFDTHEKVRIGMIGERPESFFLDQPVLCTTGASNV